MNANPKFLAATAHVDEAAVEPLPSSRKIYVDGSRPDSACRCARSRKPTRPPRSAPRTIRRSTSTTPPGPYTDPEAQIDIRSGLAPLRARWIEERGDTEVLARPSSVYGRERLADPKLAEMRFDLKRRPRRAKAGRNVTQMHYARRGIDHAGDGVHRDSRELQREQMARGFPIAKAAICCATASRRVVRRRDPALRSRRNSCATKSRAAAPSSRPTSTIRKPSR